MSQQVLGSAVPLGAVHSGPLRFLSLKHVATVDGKWLPAEPEPEPGGAALLMGRLPPLPPLPPLHHCLEEEEEDNQCVCYRVIISN